jgi:hypothetical protein
MGQQDVGRLLPSDKTWTSRIQWLEDAGGHVKLKIEDESQRLSAPIYREVIAAKWQAEIVWKRFKEGQTIDDAISILATPVPPGMASRRANPPPA